jgi:hypothetical protein
LQHGLRSGDGGVLLASIASDRAHAKRRTSVDTSRPVSSAARSAPCGAGVPPEEQRCEADEMGRHCDLRNACHVADGIMFEFALSLAACTTADPFEITYIVYLNVKHFETQNHL